jgi:hypothetical protein
MGRLYQMRSRVEHLHQPVFDDWPGNERERRLIVLREGVFLEELSRRCIAHFCPPESCGPISRATTHYDTSGVPLRPRGVGSYGESRSM